jgi:hypothetical protein
MLTNLRRRFIASRFKNKDLNIIEQIPLNIALKILTEYKEEGWELSREYECVSSLEFLGQCTIQRGQSKLIFEYLQDSQCSIVGPARIVGAIAQRYDLLALPKPSAMT